MACRLFRAYQLSEPMRKTAVTPLLMHWSYLRWAIDISFNLLIMQISTL